MLVPNAEGCKNIILADKETHMQSLSKTIGKTLSSFTKAVNLQNQTTGNLFQKKTRAKLLADLNRFDKSFYNHEHVLTFIHHIHQNPLKAKLVSNLGDWTFSYYPDYYNNRNGTICNKVLTMSVLDLSPVDFKKEIISRLNDDIVDGIF